MTKYGPKWENQKVKRSALNNCSIKWVGHCVSEVTAAATLSKESVSPPPESLTQIDWPTCEPSKLADLVMGYLGTDGV